MGKHYNERTEDSISFSPFMAGALIGAGVALLFAPQTGSELRGMLRDYANRAKEDLEERGQEALDMAVEQGKEYYEKGEALVQEAGRSVKEFAKQGARKGQETVKDARHAADEFAKQAKEGTQKAGQY